MKLAKAAAQQLKGVIVEYDVLCSTLIGRSVSEQAEEQRRKLAAAAAAKKKQEEESGLFGGKTFASVSNMFVSDVRSLLKDLNQDSTGKPWVVKDRLQSVMQGLPSQCTSIRAHAVVQQERESDALKHTHTCQLTRLCIVHQHCRSR